MVRTLRAFAWLRWRMFVNSLEHSGARDTVQRFSIAIENLGPLMAAVLMIPSALGLAALGAAAGYALGAGNETSILFEVIRYLLLVVPVLCIFGPLFLPAADRTNPIRMLLLPISRATMYVAQTGSAFGDPWILLMIPAVAGVPVGLAAAGAIVPALFAVVAGAVLVITVVGISSLATSLLHLAVRDRRRGELLALLLIVVLPLLGMLPGLMDGDRRQRNAQSRREGRPPQQRVVPGWAARSAETAFSLVPTELYARGTREAARGGSLAATAPLGALATIGLLLHACGMYVFGRVLDSPGSTGARRAAPMRGAWGRTLPFLSPGASAVALAQFRLALRTPRGRSIMISPFLMLVLFGVMMRRNGGMNFGPIAFETGLGLAVFTSFVGLLSILPIAMNQFAVDKAGLTLALLSPLTDGEYLAGKAVGNGIIAGVPAVLCMGLAAVAFPGGRPVFWITLPLALLASYCLVAPAAAVFSAIFPRVVDMNSIGKGSNAHGAAGLFGLLAFATSILPCALLALAATRWLHQPMLAPIFMLMWCIAAFAIGRLLFIPARRIFDARRENFAMLF